MAEALKSLLLLVPSVAGAVLAERRSDLELSLADVVDRLNRGGASDVNWDRSKVLRYEQGKVQMELSPFLDLCAALEMDPKVALVESIRREYLRKCKSSKTIDFCDTEFGKLAASILQLHDLESL